MTPPLDIDKLRYSNPQPPDGDSGGARVFKTHQKGKFLKGPIPWAWLVKALQLPGKSIHVAIVIWFWCGIRKKTETHLNLSRLRLVGISRFAGARGLLHLERAGLISASRRQGSRPLIKILDVPSDEEAEEK